MSQRKSFLIAVFALMLAASTVAAMTPDQLQNSTDSAVFLRVYRVFQNTDFPTTGSGFFIHPDGYVVTNWHVVADEIEMTVYGRKQDIVARVLRLEAVLHSGMPNERVVRAKVITTDRKRDLALIKVNTDAPAWIEPTDLPEVKITDKVWVLGFPFGGLLALDRNASTELDDVNPAISINSGMITSLRHDDRGELASLQTDAAVNPGNSGGPLLDDQGRLVGVVKSMIRGGQGVGFAVAPNVVENFVRSRSVKVSFEPRLVVSPPEPIKVTVEPILASDGHSKVEVEVASPGLPRVVTPLERTDWGAWVGTVQLPEVYGTDAAPERVVMEVAMTPTDGGRPQVRRYGVDRLPADSIARITSERPPTEMMADRKVNIEDGSINDHAKAMRSRGKGLSDVAGNVQLKKSANGTITIDQNTVDTIGDPFARRLADSRYEFLDLADHKLAAAQYDILVIAEDELGRYERMAKNYQGSRIEAQRREAAKAEAYIARYQKAILTEKAAIEKKVKKFDLLYCIDDEHWYISTALPEECASVHRP